MKKNFNRHPVNLTTLKFIRNNKIVITNWKNYYKKYNISGIIQILPTDFNLIKK